LGLLGFLGAWTYFGFTQAGQMRAMQAPHHFQMYLPTMSIEWLMFGYIVYGVRSSGVSLKELLGPRWSKGKGTLIDIGIAAAFWIGSLIVLAIVGHLMRMKSGMDSIKFMLPEGPLEMVFWVLLSITAGICEETIFRAYLQRQFTAWTRSLPVGVVLSAAFFGAGHIYQSGRQAILIGVYGLLFGALAAARRSVKPGMMAHAWHDSVAGILSSILAKRHLFGA
jgi:membrane protease YdiL (CAAX protease family)